MISPSHLANLTPFHGFDRAAHGRGRIKGNPTTREKGANPLGFEDHEKKLPQALAEGTDRNLDVERPFTESDPVRPD